MIKKMLSLNGDKDSRSYFVTVAYLINYLTYNYGSFKDEVSLMWIDDRGLEIPSQLSNRIKADLSDTMRLKIIGVDCYE